MSADGSQAMPGGVSAEAMRLQSMIDAAERRGEEKGRQREEQANLTQRMSAVELDVRETKNSVQEIKTMLAAHFGAPAQQAQPAPQSAPAASGQTAAGWAALTSKALDVVKLIMWALVLMAAGMVLTQGGPRAHSIIEQTLGG
jgi:hypothetical protein